MPPEHSAAREGGDPVAEVLDISISGISIESGLEAAQSTLWRANGSLGHYRLVNRIGSGGMGEVWLAEQTQPVRRQVALKLIKAGMDTGEVVMRFQSERQALALMDHPGIAKVFEAGSTPQGRPYFAMEFIAGVPITQYCDEHKMTVRERLELFVQVCDAVQHAHQKAIIHRDLKPSNILVSEVDGKPLPRIIDFGVAKAISHGLLAETQFTNTGAIVGTPPYMSPEQAGSVGVDVDTRTDVYSLGVVLYELLVGARPLDLHGLAFDQAFRRLREEESPRPSTRLRTLRDESTIMAGKRASDPPTLIRQLRGDLDAIALKALEKDRTRRYGSPSDFAADIERYLRHEPVLAVPPSTVYRARKFARRYRAALATVAAFVLVLIVAAAVSIRQSIRANSEATVAQAINDFLRNDLLAQASAARQSGPNAKPDPDLKVRTALDRAAARIAGRFNRQPELEASIRNTIGQTYMDLGLYPEARTQLDRTLNLQRQILGSANPTTLETMSSLGWIYWLQGEYPQAEELLGRAVAVQRRVLGPDHPDTLSSMNNLANVYLAQGQYAEAEALHRKTAEIRRRVLGPEHRDTLVSMTNLVNVYASRGKYVQAETLDGQILEIRRRVLGSEHPETVMSMNNLATDYELQGKYAQAEALLSQTLEIDRRVLGSEHPDALRAMSNLADVYAARGNYTNAEVLDRQNLGITRRVLGSEHPDTLGSMTSLAGVYAARGNYAQAEALDRQVIEIQRRVLGPKHPDTLTSLSYLASLYQRWGKYGLAQTYAQEALAERRQTLSSEDTATMTAAADLALAYLSQGKFVESEPLSREALAFAQKSQPGDWQRFRAESLLGASLAGQRNYAGAEPLLLAGYAGMAARKDRMAAPDWYHLDRAREWIIQLYRASGKPKKAAEWRKK
jgi:serine/threonine protein kinase/Tfp pilus assembly protein PilF